ncbi:MAG: adenylyl-sulfate kinase [Fidelibacterota bacterium]
MCQNEQKGFTLWLTGLSGAGKTTVSRLLESEFSNRKLKVEVLDGDVIRTNLSRGLGYSREDREINLKRIGFVCKLLSRNNVIAIAAAITPYQNVRDFLREDIENYIEVYVSCPLEICIKRDPKGLYKKALKGEIENFTGISDPYEEPKNSDITLYTDRESPEESAKRVVDYLEDLNLIPKKEREVYTREEEEEINRRLESLGYL